jgi:eukaryotic-like serine/threonine-protein kinase
VVKEDSSGIEGLIVSEHSGRRNILASHKGEILVFPEFSSSGHIVYQRGFPTSFGIWAIPISRSSFEATGDPFLVTEDGQIPNLSDDGTLLYHHTSQGGGQQIVWVDRSGRIGGSIGQPQESLSQPSFSPDGRRIAVSALSEGSKDIWVYDIDQEVGIRITSNQSVAGMPTWSPDGRQIAYQASDPFADIYQIAVDGSQPAKGLLRSKLDERHPFWAQGDKLLFQSSETGSGSNADIWYLPSTIDQAAIPVWVDDFTNWSPSLSPDGRYVVYQSNESGKWEIYVREFPSGIGKRTISIDGGYAPKWSRQSDEVFYVKDNTIIAIPVTLDPTFLAGKSTRLFSGDKLKAYLAGATDFFYDVSPNGERFAIVQNMGDGAQSAVIVQNWYAEFKDR